MRKLLHVVSFIIIALLATALLGCGGGDKKTAVDTQTKIQTTVPSTQNEGEKGEDLQVTSSGYSKWSRMDSYSIAGVISNPNDDLVAEQADVNVTVFGAGDVVLNTSSEYIYKLYPGAESGFTTYYDGQGGDIARIDVTTIVDSWKKPEASHAEFTFSNTAFFENKITGMVSSNLDENISKVQVVAVCYDANGAVVGGDKTIIDQIPAGGRSAFDLSYYGANPAAINYYGQLLFTSEIGE